MPLSALLTFDSIPPSSRDSHKGITVHGLLASFIAFGRSQSSFLESWKASWPSLQDFQELMPMLWPEILRDPYSRSSNFSNSSVKGDDPLYLIPPTVGGRGASNGMRESFQERETIPLYRQEQKLKSDWEIVSKAFPTQTLPEYVYYWLVVNTRSFYFDVFEGDVTDNHDDRMVLCPFVDYFNHKDQGVSSSIYESSTLSLSDSVM